MKISKLLAEKKGYGVVHSISENASLLDAAKKLTEHRIGALIVTSDNETKNVGIISERDLVQLISEGCDFQSTHTGQAMTKDVIVATSNDELETVMGIMTRHHIRHVPIIENAKIIGMVSIQDVIESMHQEAEICISYLSDFGGTYGSQVY